VQPIRDGLNLAYQIRSSPHISLLTYNQLRRVDLRIIKTAETAVIRSSRHRFTLSWKEANCMNSRRSALTVLLSVSASAIFGCVSSIDKLMRYCSDLSASSSYARRFRNGMNHYSKVSTASLTRLWTHPTRIRRHNCNKACLHGETQAPRYS